MSLHFLKVSPKYYEPLLKGAKLFEIRKTDRPFKVMDTVILEEFDTEKKIYTGRHVSVWILYILTNEEFPEGIKPGYCILSVKTRHTPPEALSLLAKAGSPSTSKEVTNV